MEKKSGIKSKSPAGSSDSVKIEKVLIDNFVSLQKVMTNLAVKFDNLSSQISKLLELFEISAKTLAEKDYSADKKITEKIDNLLEQNKVIAKAVTLLHERVPEQSVMQRVPITPAMSQQRMQPSNFPRFPQQKPENQ